MFPRQIRVLLHLKLVEYLVQMSDAFDKNSLYRRHKGGRMYEKFAGYFHFSEWQHLKVLVLYVCPHENTFDLLN